ncbi:MAG: LacI family DNA-binding transcriptional regulator [Spirochaetes bacterium]|nr:LacI family DNA-binding transcriptional regulator [Spirochaetota bacterium]
MAKTIEDLAKRIGVSYTTISRAINRPHLVREETRRKIREAMEHYGIFPNTSARGLKLGQPKTVGLMVARSSNFFYLEMVNTFQMEAYRRGYLLVLHTYDAAKPAKDTPFGSHIPLNGIIVQVMEHEAPLLSALASQHVPLVSVSNIPRDDIPLVASDDAYNMKQLASVMKSRITESDNIAFFSIAPQNFSVEERIRGFSAVLNRDAASSIRNFDSYDEMNSELEHLIQTRTLPRVIMAMNDYTAVKIILTLTRQGIRVPEDVIVSGYDNVSLVREMGMSFPTVDPLLSIQARTTFDILEAINSSKPLSVKKHLVKGEVIA